MNTEQVGNILQDICDYVSMYPFLSEAGIKFDMQNIDVLFQAEANLLCKNWLIMYVEAFLSSSCTG